MGQYDRKDRFYEKAKSEGHASRAYYKIEQIQSKYQIFKTGDSVLDLGCSPGGWLEYLSKIVGNKGKALGIDILPLKIDIRPNIDFIQGDINDEGDISKVKELIGSADVVVSDIAPSISGIKFKDAYLSYELALRALDIAKEILKEGGHFVTKIFPGEELAAFKKELQSQFEKIHQYRPEATRKTSIEVYLIGKGYFNVK